jgi:hypothetical protein
MSSIEDAEIKLGPMALADGHTVAGARQVIYLEQLFDVFGLENGDWRGLALRLSYGRWRYTLVIDDRPQLGRPPDPDIAVADQIFISEVASIQNGCLQAVRELTAAKCTIADIVAKTNIPTTLVKKIQRGERMSDRAAVYRHLKIGGALRGLNDNEIKKKVDAATVRHTRAIKTYGRPK